MVGQIVNILVVLCSVVLTSSIQTQKTIYLLSDESRHGECPTEECFSFTAFVANSDLLSNNLTDITIALLPGIYSYSGTSEGVIHISNTTSVELKAVDPSVGATVISCNNSKGIGIALSYISSVVIRGITFEGCGASIDTIEYFTLSISYSNNVTIQNLTIKYCKGVALKVEYLKNALVLRDSTFIHNQANIYIFTRDVEKETQSKTIVIVNSLFMSGHYISGHRGTNNLPKVTNPGITMLLNQTRSYAVVNLTDIHMYAYPQDIFSTGYCQIHHNMYTTSVHIERLQCNTEYVGLVRYLLYGYRAIPGLIIEPRNYSSVSTKNNTIGSITINNAYFNNSRVQIGPILRSAIEFHVMLANISIEHTIDPLTIVNMGSVTLQNITITDSDGVMCIAKCKQLIIHNQLMHQRNRGQLLIFYINNMTFQENSTFFMNFSQQVFKYPEDWPFYIVGTTVRVYEHSTLTITNSVGSNCGGLVLEKTNILFEGNSKWFFQNNTGKRGGAMVYRKKSKLSASGSSMTTITFINNRASRVGGAIFVVDSDYITKGNYLGDDAYETFTIGSGITFYFENNTAGQAGSAIFGGWIDQSLSKFEFKNQLQSDLSLVSSDPTKLCLCSKELLNYNRTVDSVALIPGEKFSIGVVAVGQRNGVVPSSVLANFLGQTSALLERLQYTQNVGTKCTNLEYTVQSVEKTEALKLTVASTNNYLALQHNKNIDTDISININLKNCSLGFYLDSKLMKCQCQEILSNHDIKCNLTTFKILRESPKWINATLTHLDSFHKTGVIVHDRCPFDYCKLTKGYNELNLTDPDEQCAFNRSGILCGACQTNFSRVMGTSKCKRCTKHWIALIIPLMVIAGVALVVGLIILNLTVSVGTINGLVFYANILRANHATFFPYEISNSFLSMFIAWLNLDLGIEICFYDDLDAFKITWFQFLFPLYIWFIVIIIIVASHYSTRVSKLCGSNALQVLATLFLLSYAKLLRIIITVFSSTELVYPDGHESRVWLYDGNVDYLKGKHVYLFVVASILLVFISLPYTTILLLVQLLQRFSNHKILSWVTKLHPLFDAYTGPYKSKHRYWTGLLLLIRACLFLVFSVNVLGDPKVNLLAVSLTALILCGYNSIIRGVYKNWLLNLIEVSFILNLGILAAIAHYQLSSGTSIKPVTYTSTGIAFVIFVALILYHLEKRILFFKWVQALKSKMHCSVKRKNQKTTKPSNIGETTTVTSSSVDLRELLLSL